MNLYVVRHAEALPMGRGIVRDADRPLSARGEHDAALVGRVLSMGEPAARTIASSPLLRARRTAEIIAGQFADPPQVSLWPILQPGIENRAVLGRAKEQAEGPLILVAHQPDLTEFVSWLVADAPAEIAFPPGSVASIVIAHSIAGTGARLQWIITPKLVSLLHPEW